MLQGSIWTSLLVMCLGQDTKLLYQNLCSNKGTCTECVQTPRCSWCFAADFNGTHCFNSVMEGGIPGCDETYIFNPDNHLEVDPLYNRELSRASKGKISTKGVTEAAGKVAEARTSDDLVQIKPQKVKLQLRMNQMQKLTFAYTRAEDYPIDLYYVMDLSYSMKNNKHTLSKLGNLLSATMKNMTSNFRIGFGLFVDKVVMPYASITPEHIKAPCEGCAPPYSFRNHMSLSTDTDRFEQAVADAPMSGNLDMPESGLDAIMQAAVCKEQIGWREQARRLLVYSSDDGFHYAGDGKLGGILNPNDGLCHMEDDIYTYGSLQDYPSVSQVNYKVTKNAINVIFAVTEQQIKVYQELSKHIYGSSSGILDQDSKNVIELVRDQYNKITSSVEIRDTSSDAVQIDYYSSCLGGEELVQTKKCDGLKVGDVIEFTAEITLKKCPKDRKSWKQTFDISPVGVSDKLVVELEMICDCPCAQPGHLAYNASPLVCSGEGISACGVCVCGAGRFGKSCECSAHGGVSAEQERGCRPTNASAGPLCSNRGTCICGVCECNKMDDPLKVISGPFCECDNFTCDRNKGQLCSGAGHGDCVCGKCSCAPAYTGPACQCLKDQEPCRSPVNSEICSGNGKCVCGQCMCNVEDDKHFTGQYCENSYSYTQTCPGYCGELKDCVLCLVHKQGPLYNKVEGSCGKCALAPKIEEGKIEVNESLSEHLCSFYDDENCLYVYVYSIDEAQRLLIRAQKERECPNKAPIISIIIGVTAAAIMMIGMVMLIAWKVITTVLDRREFSQFEKECLLAETNTGMNPIYKGATTTFNNPTFATE